MSCDTILAVDIGGTKMLAALVTGAGVDDERDVATPRDRSAEGWCDELARSSSIGSGATKQWRRPLRDK